MLVREVSPLLGPLCDDVLRVQLRHTLEIEAVSAAERAAGALPGARSIAVAFADLVGFTRLGEAVPPEELENLASRLTSMATMSAAPPVRFIKTIGDAVMLVSPDPVALLPPRWNCLPLPRNTTTSRRSGWESHSAPRSLARGTGSAVR